MLIQVASSALDGRDEEFLPDGFLVGVEVDVFDGWGVEVLVGPGADGGVFGESGDDGEDAEVEEDAGVGEVEFEVRHEDEHVAGAGDAGARADEGGEEVLEVGGEDFFDAGE